MDFHSFDSSTVIFNITGTVRGSAPRGHGRGVTGQGQRPTSIAVNRTIKTSHAVFEVTCVVCVLCAVGNLQCLQTWTEDNRKYVIARRLRDGATSSGANCFVSGSCLIL